MPTLFEVHPVDRAIVAAAVNREWGVTLGESVKASQNHTFRGEVTVERHGSAAVGTRVAVRVTPDPAAVHHQRIEDELVFVDFLARSEGTGVCPPLLPSSSSSSSFAVREGPYTICVVRWAAGSLIDFMGYRWVTDADVIRAWGATAARIHVAARAFAAAKPEVAARIRPWTAVHDGIMAPAEASLHEEDAAMAKGGLGEAYGLLHGDLNVSNFHLVEGGKVEEEGGEESTPTGGDAHAAGSEGGAPPRPVLSLAVFDTDQVQQGWWEYDLAQSALTTVMLHEAGSLPDGSQPVPQADPAFFVARLVEGYEAVPGSRPVDRARLQRMLALRKDFYLRFCSRAVREGGIPADMAWFISYVMKRWFKEEG
jgi:hypothetical protein